MNPNDLLDQADLLVNYIGMPSGRPLQVNLRRAISNAYYALFHFAMRAGADMAVGASTRRNVPQLYARAYRSINHNELRDRSGEVRARTTSANIRAFVDATIELQKARHDGDYDPFYRATKTIANEKIQMARDAIAAFEAATADEQKACLAFLLFKERRP
jgi:hypothetical protein